MKRAHTLIVALLSLFIFLGQGGQGSEDVLKNLNTFQQSLSQWMRSVEALDNRIRTLERIQQQGGGPELMKTLSEVTASVSALRKELTDSYVRLKNIEDTVGSTKGDPTIVFGETLKTMKKSLSDLTKKVEDQAVLTSVLQQRYQEFIKPLEPIKKALEEEKEISKGLVSALEEYKKELASKEKEMRERVTAMESFLSASEERAKAMEEVLRRVENIEKQTGVAPPPELVKTEGTVTEAAPEAVKPKTPEEEGFREIGGGFYVRNVIFTPFGSSARTTGELKNLSNNNYSIAIFNIKVYDLVNTMVSSQDFTIKGFKDQDIKSFKEIITGADPQKIGRYTISFKETY